MLEKTGVTFATVKLLRNEFQAMDLKTYIGIWPPHLILIVLLFVVFILLMLFLSFS